MHCYAIWLEIWWDNHQSGSISSLCHSPQAGCYGRKHPNLIYIYTVYIYILCVCVYIYIYTKSIYIVAWPSPKLKSVWPAYIFSWFFSDACHGCSFRDGRQRATLKGVSLHLLLLCILLPALCLPELLRETSPSEGWTQSSRWRLTDVQHILLPLISKYLKKIREVMFLMGKLTISMAMFNSKLLVYQRVYLYVIEVPSASHMPVTTRPEPRLGVASARSPR